MNLLTTRMNAHQGHIDDARLTTQTHPWRIDLAALLIVLLIGAAAVSIAYRTPITSTIDLGTTYARPYISGFTDVEKNSDYTYAFSTEESEVRFPGVGAGPHRITLRLSEWRTAPSAPTFVTLRTPSTMIGSFLIHPRIGLRSYHLLVPSTQGDITLRWSGTTSTSTTGDPRMLGVIVDQISDLPLRKGVAPGQLVAILAIGLLIYLLLRQLASGPLGALTFASVAILVLAGLLGSERLWWTIYTPRLVVLLIGLNLALWPLRRLTIWLWARGGVTLTPQHEIWLWRFLIIAALVKIGGVVYPHIIVFDERWHVPRTRLVLDGKFMELIVPSRVTALGVTVGLEGGHFPYSPLWYLITAPFDWFGIDLGIASNTLNAVLDISRSLLIVYIAMRLFGRQRAALCAGGIYHLFAMPYYLLSWGNWPTQLGLWGALVLLAVVVATYDHPAERRAFIALAAAALLAILTYTVVGIVASALICILALLEWLQRTNRLGATRARTLIGALLVAETIAFLLYHIWYVPTIVTDTLPAILRAMSDPNRHLHDQVKPGLLSDLAVNGSFALNHLTWGILGPLPIAALLAWHQARRARSLLIAWVLIFVLFSLFSWAVADMIFKHIFFILPLVALCMGLLLAALWSQRGWAARLTTMALLLYLACACTQDWYTFIMIKRH